jgi:hypothetical protein
MLHPMYKKSLTVEMHGTKYPFGSTSKTTAITLVTKPLETDETDTQIFETLHFLLSNSQHTIN